ncbi:MAG: hypothetical protein ACD_76C00045G0018 [uncultured bacterium]|nr:MAG: hypothetical protein ACD_76C00045G0018 [uncultured bacterium]HBD05226.1 sodium:proton exchanger [Candidatus Uhrbacteria bacterium]
MFTYLLFFIGFFLLIKGADLLVEGSASIAKKFNISRIVIGLTIVAFGTSAPEFVVNIFASINGNTEIAIGNILGSNIVNIMLILGLSAIIYPIAAKKNTTWKEIPLSLLAALLVGIMANDMRFDGASFSGLTRIDGMVLLAFFIIFIYYSFGIAKITGEVTNEVEIKDRKQSISVFCIILGLLSLVVGGKWIVDGAVSIAHSLNISESLIGLTIVAIGTSLPELATSVIAAYKKQTDIAIGNIVGSNIFNVFLILGASSVIRPLPFSPSSDIDILMTVFASAILFFAMFIGRRHVLERWQGALMILFYIGYVAFLISTK